MEFFVMLMHWASKRRWELIVIAVLFTVITLMANMAVNILPTVQKETTKQVIQEEIIPVIEAIDDIRCSIDEINEREYDHLLNAGIQAYNKFNGLSGTSLYDKLESSTQNALAAKNALEVQKIREYLMQIDRNLTMELLDYWGIV